MNDLPQQGLGLFIFPGSSLNAECYILNLIVDKFACRFGTISGMIA